MAGFDLSAEVKKQVERVLEERGRVNVIIAGRTGVGKSTLVNAVFQGQLAETGQGRPVTRSTREITKEGIPLTVFDTRGLELDRCEETLGELEALVKDRAARPRPVEHLHVAWVCVSEDGRRVEEGEIRLHALLAGHMPVLGVVTKARADQGFRAEVQRLLPLARNVVRVRALAEEDDEGNVLRPRGLPELVDATMEIVPEGQRNALAAAQRVSVEQKVRRARGVVAASAATAAGIGAAPIPFSDSVLLVPMEVGMLAGITAVFGLPLDRGFLTTLIGSALGGGGASLAGRAILSGLLKLVPGAGSAAGGAIAAATAASLTTAVGEAYIRALVLLTAREGGPPSEREIAEAFGAELSRRDGR
jgi:uncharacterized protein (DUF697 family)